MSEIVVISEGATDLEVRETETMADAETEKKETAPSVVRWEKFLPRMVVRVLLVEADDSTRQIITALLRKCSYRVAAVADGLKAWEVLKGRPHNIDLILTEVDLPSISGFALLTLIMEHDICKNIPVIMMSSHDSVSTVYKCMLRGAADFLVKPVRKNELRNLWQHIWRRQASNAGGLGPQDESVAQQKVEATAENNAASSNHSSGYVACIQINKECIEKGSDAQSSSTKPDLEGERECLEYIKNPTEPIGSKSLADEIKIQKREENVQKSHTDKDANTVTEGEDMQPGSQREHPNLIIEACDNNQALGNSFMEAIDLIGAFDNYPRCIYRSSGSYNGMNHIDSSPLLDLSLRRSHPSSSVNQVTEERPILHHSDASAFSRYVNRGLQSPLSTAANVCNKQRHNLTTSDKQFSNPISYCVSGTHGPTVSAQKNILSLPSGQAEISIPSPQQKVFPISIPVRGLRFENLCAAYGSVMPPSQSPCSATHQEPSFRVTPFHQTNSETKTVPQQNPNNSSNQMEPKRWHKLDSSEDQGRLFSPPEHSGSSSFGNVNPVPIVRAVESGNEGNVVHDGNSHRSLQREAALTKFRLKRKDRCYEKKVRYESRKKLAEQRPRVKGQFVRHQQTDSPPVETDNQCGNSVDG